jgi:hypothetical protein
MLRLDLSKKPRWVDLGFGVRIEVAPLSTIAMTAARRDAEFIAVAKRISPENLTDEQAQALLSEREEGDALTVAFTKAIAKRVISAWEGVGDAEGNPAPVTDEGVSALLDLFPIFQAFQNAYMLPGLELVTEGNGLSPLPNGILAGATTIAGPAPASAKPAPQKRTRPKR